jgi:hypothetical protein
MTLDDVYLTRPSLDTWVKLTDLYPDPTAPLHLGQVLAFAGPEPTVQCLMASPAPLARRIAARWVLEGTPLPAEPPAALLTVLQRLARGQAVDTRTLDLANTQAWGLHTRQAPTAYDRLRGLLTACRQAMRQCEFALLCAYVTSPILEERLWAVYHATDPAKAKAIMLEELTC